MINWNNLDTLTSFKELSEVERVNLAEVMSGANGAERVKDYSVPMTEDLTYNYAAKAVDDKVLAALAKLAKEAQLTEKYAALYNGEVINTGEKRLVLHQLTRGQLGDKVEAGDVIGTIQETSENSMLSSSRGSQILPIKYMPARSQMQQVRNSQQSYRSVSAEVTLVLVQCILHLRTGQRRTAHSRWMRSSSAT